MYAIRVIRLIVALLYFAVYTSAFILISIMTLGLATPYIWHWACRGWGWGLLKISGIELRVIDRHYLDAPGPKIVMFTHQSLLDLLWIGATLVPRAVAVVKREFIFYPFVNLAFYLAGCIFIDRKDRADAIARMQAGADQVIRQKSSLYIAPEGTRSATDQLLPFKKGGFHLALMGKLPIHPIVVGGAHGLLPKGKLMPKPGALIVKCLPPIFTEDWNIHDLDQHIAEIRNLMQKELASVS